MDAIATKRFDAQTGADREVQRILIELLTQMDGFDQDVNVKVIMATNRADTLDPALLRPGRLDRKIEFPNPSRREKRLIFQTITGKMSIGADVDLEDCQSDPFKPLSPLLSPSWPLADVDKTDNDGTQSQTSNARRRSRPPRSRPSARQPVSKPSARTGTSPRALPLPLHEESSPLIQGRNRVCYD